MDIIRRDVFDLLTGDPVPAFRIVRLPDSIPRVSGRYCWKHGHSDGCPECRVAAPLLWLGDQA